MKSYDASGVPAGESRGSTPSAPAPAVGGTTRTAPSSTVATTSENAPPGGTAEFKVQSAATMRSNPEPAAAETQGKTKGKRARRMRRQGHGSVDRVLKKDITQPSNRKDCVPASDARHKAPLAPNHSRPIVRIGQCHKYPGVGKPSYPHEWTRAQRARDKIAGLRDPCADYQRREPARVSMHANPASQRSARSKSTRQGARPFR